MPTPNAGLRVWGLRFGSDCRVQMRIGFGDYGLNLGCRASDALSRWQKLGLFQKLLFPFNNYCSLCRVSDAHSRWWMAVPSA